MISDLGFGGFVSGYEQRSQFASLSFQCGQPARRQQAAFLCKLEPNKRFVGFLQDAPDLVNPIRLTAGATGSAVAGGYRSCGS